MTDQKNNILEVRDLVVDFPIFGGIMQRRVNSVHAVRKVSFDLIKGETLGIVGESGSGKSTLLNILGMLDEADEGSYMLDNVPIKNLNEKIAAKYRNKFLGVHISIL